MMRQFLKTTFCLLCLILVARVLYAQEPITAPEVAPVSPNAASLGQYGETPVDLYHGLPQINIPLYMIEMDGVQVPISLSFHSSGHKVRTIASWVGLGWSLNAGGVVTRSMRGRPDNSADPNGFFNNMAMIDQWEADGSISQLIYPELQIPESNPTQQQMHNLHVNNHDTQADIFYYNYPGGTGKFMFKPDGSVMQMPYNDLNISFSGNDTSAPTITTPDGIQASFTATETSEFSQGANEQDAQYLRFYSSAYYLSKYKSLISGKEVTFDYKYPQQSISGDAIPQEVITERMVEYPPDYTYTRSQVQNYESHSPVYLDSISWESGSIDFISSATRIDQEHAEKLDEIVIKDKANKVIKRYIFHYMPFGGSHGVHQTLILRAVTEVGWNGEQKPPYVFDYYDLNSLPARDSKAMDMYGYYNGAVNNTSLIPEFFDIELFLPRSNGDRSIVKDVARVGMLRNIHYPTGGQTNFTYESNEYYSDQPGLSPYTRSFGTVALAESCTADGSLYYDEASAGIIGLQCQDDIESSVITIPEDAFNRRLLLSHKYGPNAIINHNGSDEIFILDLIEVDEHGNEAIISSYSGLNTNMAVTDIIDAGKTYKMRSRTNIAGTLLMGTISYQYLDLPEDGNVNNYLGPGLRIAKIETYDAKGKTTTKHYEYKMKDDPTRSSGRLLAKRPSYHKEKIAWENIPPDPNIWGDGNGGLIPEAPLDVLNVVRYRTTTAQPTGILGDFGGDQLVYDEVVEREEGNGHTRYFYSFHPDGVAGNNLQAFPEGFPNTNIHLKQISSTFWKRGKLDSVQVYDENDQLLNQSKNFYSFHEIDESKTFHYEFVVDRLQSDGIFTNSYLYVYEKQRTGWGRLDSTSNYTYENGQTSVTSSFNGYDDRFPPKILAPEITYSYLDGVNDSHVETIFLNDDLLLPENIQYFNADNELLTKQVYSYQGNNPIQIDTYLGAGTTSDYSLRMSEYNGSKPSFVQPPSGVNIVYLWAYGNTLPVAKISNVTYTEITGLLGSNFDILQSSYDNDQIKAILSTLRSSLSTTKSMVSFTHLEGIGVEEIIDDQGLSTIYQYDGLNRLKSVQDFEGNYLQYYEYNYGINPFTQYQYDANGFGDPLNGDNPNTSEDGSTGGNNGGDTDGEVDEPLEEGAGN